jgi:hypothetical protein
LIDDDDVEELFKAGGGVIVIMIRHEYCWRRPFRDSEWGCENLW